MAITLVDVGTTANDGTGDPLRTAFQTVNTALTTLDPFFSNPLTAAELGELQNIGATTISAGQWGYLGALDQALATTDSPTFAGLTDVTGNATFSGDVIFGAGTTFWDVSAGFFKIPLIASGAATGSLSIGGGAAYNSGANILLYGDTHPQASGMLLRRGTVSALRMSGPTGDLEFYNAGATVGMTWVASALSNAGAIGVGTNTPTAQVDLSSNTIRVRTAKTPASAAATGNAGDICWDTGYIYVCTATNTWKRAAIATW